MIYTERKVTIKNDSASIDMPIILYRGDREVELQFTIIDSKFRFESNKGNIIDSTQASYAQLAIALPNGTDLFTDIIAVENGLVIFTITGEMIDEINEIGFYSFHIRLYNDDKSSRITLPPVMKGIEIKEPLVIESDLVDGATVGYATIQSYGVEEPAFDEDGNYIKTDWQTGDKITASKLNKIEETLDTINNDIPTKTSELTNDSNFLTSVPSEYITETELNAKGYLTEHQDLSDYAKTADIPTKTSELTNDSGLVSRTDLENCLTLGYGGDGKLYIFYDGVSIGTGVEISAVTGVIDEDNNIILSGNLTNGTYTIRYKYEDGTFSDAITVSIGDVEVYKNLLPEALEEGLTEVYNGVGYKENMRWSGTNQAFVSATQCVLTGLIPIGNDGDVFHIRGVDIVRYVDGRQSGWSHFYDSEGNRLQMAVNILSAVIGTDTNGDFTITMDRSLYSVPTGAAYIRFQLGEINGDFIISRNFLIP